MKLALNCASGGNLPIEGLYCFTKRTLVFIVIPKNCTYWITPNKIVIINLIIWQFEKHLVNFKPFVFKNKFISNFFPSRHIFYLLYYISIVVYFFSNNYILEGISIPKIASEFLIVWYVAATSLKRDDIMFSSSMPKTLFLP